MSTTQDPMPDIERNIDYCGESEEEDVSTKTPTESPRRNHKEPIDKLVLIETQKNMDGRIFRIYSIQNSRNANNFMIAQELDEETSDVWDCNRPADCEVETMSQVIDFIATLKYDKTRKNVDSLDGHCRKKRKQSEHGEKNTKRVREGIKKGIVHSWNSNKGYGFVQEDETNENIFFHMSNLVHREWLPRKGEHVEYKLQFNNKKMRDTAINVCTVSTNKHQHTQNYRQDRRDHAGQQAPHMYGTPFYPTEQRHNNNNNECKYDNA